MVPPNDEKIETPEAEESEVATPEAEGQPEAEEGATDEKEAEESEKVIPAETSAGKEGVAVATTQPYTPNYKYKANNAEHEFDEWVRPAITSAEVEAKVREIYEKAQGLDAVKGRLQETRDKFSETEQKYTQLSGTFTQLGEYIKREDMDSFFTALNIPPEKVIRYALQRVQYQNMPPEQRQAFDAQREERTRLYTLEQQNQQLQSQMQQQVAMQVSNEIDALLGSNDFRPLAEAFDSRMGQGSFRNEVLNRGRLHYYSHGKDMTVREAVQEAARLAGVQLQNTPTPGGTNGAQAGNGVVTTAAVQRPVIPNLSGGGGSPARKSPRSIEDLKKLADAMN